MTRREDETEEIDSFLREIARVPARQPDEDRVGQELDHFLILSRLGRGGMGVVYLALDRKLGRQVAIKVLPVETRDDAERRERLMREARSAAALLHPRIATVFEVGDHADSLYIAMEYVEGETLRARLAREGALPRAEATRIAIEVADGLACAHAHGVVHRDIKPDNVMLTADGSVKILDFGVARSQGASPVPPGVIPDAPQSPLTGTGHILGTPAYMAPEQRRGDRVDARADVYALGLMTVELLTGERHGASSTLDLDGPLGPTSAPTASLPPRLRRVLDRAMDADAANRPADGAAFARELREAVAPIVVAPRSRLLPILAVASAVLAVGGGLVGAWVWDQSRVKTTWAPQLVWRHGVPEPAGTWRTGMPHGYRFETQGGRVQRVAFVTAEGAPLAWPIAHPDSDWARLDGVSAGRELLYPCTTSELTSTKHLSFCVEQRMTRPKTPVGLEVRYDGARPDRPTAIVWRNDAERVVWEDRHIYEDDVRTVRRVDNNGLPRRSEWGAPVWREIEDDQGLVTRREWRSLLESPQDLGTGGWGVAHTYDAAGREVERTLLDAAGEPLTGVGLTTTRIQRDEDGWPIALDYTDEGGAVAGPAGCARIDIERDAWGRRLRQSCSDRTSPIPDAKGCTHTTFLHTADQTRRTCLDQDEHPTARHGWASVRLTRDGRGLPVRLEFFDQDDTPVSPTIQARLHVGKGLAWTTGPARLEARRDDAGRVVSASWFDALGAPMRSMEGWSTWRSPRNEQGWVHRWESLDASGQPTMNLYGFARTDITVTPDGDRIEKRRYLPDGAPMRSQRHIARIDVQLGRVVGWSCYDADEEPANCPTAHHRIRRVLDELGRPVERAAFGLHDEPIDLDGVHLHQRTYDANDRLIEVRRLDSRRQPVLRDNGCHRERFRRDPAGNVLEHRCFGIDDTPTAFAGTGGAAIIERVYAGMRPESVTFRGADGEVLRRTRHTYDEAGREIGERVEDADGRVLSAAVYEVDERGHRLADIRLGPDGKRIPPEQGWAETRYQRDLAGRETEARWFDAEGRATTANRGIADHRVVSTYNAMGVRASETWFGVDDRPARGPRGSHAERYVHHPTGELARLDLVAPPGQPLGSPPTLVWTYHPSRQVRSMTWLDGAGDPTQHILPLHPWPATPLSSIVFDWNRDRRLTRIGFRDADGRPVPCPAGFSDVLLSWENHREVRVRYLSGDEPVTLQEGAGWPWWHIPGTLDVDALRPIRVPTLPIVEQRGIAGFEARLYAAGGDERVRFLDWQGRPTTVDGRGGWDRAWPGGQAEDPVWVDASGRPLDR